MVDTEANRVAALRTVLETLAISQASRLARQGRLADAQELLAPHAQRPDASPAILDLLAKTHAQQGNLLEASALWTRVLKADPGNQAAAAALKRASAASGSKRWPVLIRAAAPGFGVLLVLTLMVLVVLDRISDWQADTNARLATVIEQTENLQANLDRLDNALASEQATLDRQAQQTQEYIQALRDSVSTMPGQEPAGSAPLDRGETEGPSPGAGERKTCYYVLQEGDTLSSVAAHYDVDPWTLARANLIYNLDRVFVGQQLAIPGCNPD